MIKCFKCNERFANPNELCDHIKKDHDLCGRNAFICSLCGFQFGELWSFRKHLKIFIVRHPPSEDLQDDAEPCGEFF